MRESSHATGHAAGPQAPVLPVVHASMLLLLLLLWNIWWHTSQATARRAHESARLRPPNKGISSMEAAIRGGGVVATVAANTTH